MASVRSDGALPGDRGAARGVGPPRRAAARPELRQAAVAVCVTGPPVARARLLPRRAAGRRAHAGPGGRPGGRLHFGHGTDLATAAAQLDDAVRRLGARRGWL